MAYAGEFKTLFQTQALDQLAIQFTVDDLALHHGGVSANIAYSLALLGGHPRLFGLVGGDFAPYRKRLAAVGVRLDALIERADTLTACFFANTDAANNQIGSFFAGAMAHAGEYGIPDVAPTPPDLVVISPNAPAGMARHIDECQGLNIPYIFDPSQQVAILGAEVLQRGIQGCYALACNEYEWQVIEQRTGLTTQDLIDMNKIFIHTMGENGATLTVDGQALYIPAYPSPRANYPTGAGDAFRGGLLRGMALGLPWPIAGHMGALCGTYAAEYIGTQQHHFTPAEFVARYRQEWDDDGALDALFSGVDS